MRDLVRSATQFSLSAALAGLRGLADAGRGTGSPDAASRAAWGRIEEPLQLAFQLGDDLSEDAFEILAGAWRPTTWPDAAAKLTRYGLETARFVNPNGEGATARTEWRNKVEVFRMVKGARRTLGHPRSGRFDLRTYVDRAYQLDDYPALWALEGLGHDYAATFLDDLEAGRRVRLLNDPALCSLPATSLPMLHAGLGLAFAEHLLRRLPPGNARHEIRRAVERFVVWCRESSREEYVESALESFGLEARCFFAHRAPELAAELERDGLPPGGEPRLPQLFWHGLGRALYFAPVNMLPGYGSIWHAIEMSWREASDAAARSEALAGVAYAFTMVNMSHPGVVESLLRHHGEALRGTSFATAVSAAVKVRGEITPGTAVVERFVAHQPADRVAGLWEEFVRRPSRAALLGGSPGGLYSVLDRERNGGGGAAEGTE